MTTPTPGRAGPRLPDIDRALPWRSWEDGLVEARERGAPLLCLAEPSWANASQRLALILGRDADAAGAATERFVPVRLDPHRRPDLADRLRLASVALTGTAGPPLIALLTPDGRPVLAYPTIWPEGRDEHPSLASLLRSAADLHDERPDALREEAASLLARAARPGAAPRAWDAIAEDADPRHGGLREHPKAPRPALLWRLLDQVENPPVRDHLLRTLTGMRRGGILDQLTDSFHRCARDERWIVPHFEKPVPANAALAAVYARAAGAFDDEAYARVARGAARFAMGGLDEGVMVLASDPGHYTWTPAAFQEALDPVLLQALGLHVNITRHDSPHTLFRALEPEDMGAVADDPPDVLARRIDQGKERLRFARLQRPAPAAVAIHAPAWRAETLRWLFRAAGAGLELDEERLLGHLDDLLAGPFTPAAGYARGDGEGGEHHWLEDQAAVAAACIEAARVARHQPALDAAHRLADVILDGYHTANGDLLTDRPRARTAGGAGTEASRAIVDHDLPAAVPTTIEVLRSLAHLRGDRAASYTRAANRLAAAGQDAS